MMDGDLIRIEAMPDNVQLSYFKLLTNYLLYKTYDQFLERITYDGCILVALEGIIDGFKRINHTMNAQTNFRIFHIHFINGLAAYFENCNERALVELTETLFNRNACRAVPCDTLDEYKAIHYRYLKSLLARKQLIECERELECLLSVDENQFAFVDEKIETLDEFQYHEQMCSALNEHLDIDELYEFSKLRRYLFEEEKKNDISREILVIEEFKNKQSGENEVDEETNEEKEQEEIIIREQVQKKIERVDRMIQTSQSSTPVRTADQHKKTTVINVSIQTTPAEVAEFPLSINISSQSSPDPSPVRVIINGDQSSQESDADDEELPQQEQKQQETPSSSKDRSVNIKNPTPPASASQEARHEAANEILTELIDQTVENREEESQQQQQQQKKQKGSAVKNASKKNSPLPPLIEENNSDKENNTPSILKSARKSIFRAKEALYEMLTVNDDDDSNDEDVLEKNKSPLKEITSPPVEKKQQTKKGKPKRKLFTENFIMLNSDNSTVIDDYQSLNDENDESRSPFFDIYGSKNKKKEKAAEIFGSGKKHTKTPPPKVDDNRKKTIESEAEEEILSSSSSHDDDVSELDFAETPIKNSKKKKKSPEKETATMTAAVAAATVNGSAEKVYNGGSKNSPGEKKIFSAKKKSDHVFEFDATETTKSPRLLSTKSNKRRKNAWSDMETTWLVAGIQVYGLGNWRRILQEYGTKFNEKRTNIDLRDKYRNLDKQKTLKRYEKQAAELLKKLKEKKKNRAINLSPYFDKQQQQQSETTATKRTRSSAANEPIEEEFMFEVGLHQEDEEEVEEN